MNKTILLSLIISIYLISCKYDNNMEYEGGNYIYFKEKFDSKKPNVEYTFAFTPDSIATTINLRCEIASHVMSYDRRFSIKLVDTLSTIKEGYHLDKLPEYYVLPADSSEVSVVLHINKTEDMDTSLLMATFEIIDKWDFKPGILAQNRNSISITNKLSKPKWWTSWHDNNGLGEYSDEKFHLFITVTGQYDLDYDNRDDMTYYDMRALLIQFKYYLLEHPTTEADGNLMTVAIAG